MNKGGADYRQGAISVFILAGYIVLLPAYRHCYAVVVCEGFCFGSGLVQAGFVIMTFEQVKLS